MKPNEKMKISEYIQLNEDILRKISKEQFDSLEIFMKNYLASDKTLWVAGNGGAASTASHAVADLSKTLRKNSGNHIKCISITEMVSLVTAIANDLSYEQSISMPLELFAKRGDALLLLSVSGTSPNVVQALKKAVELGIKTCVIFGKKGEKIAQVADCKIIIPSDDYQIVENIHLIMIHWLAKTLELN